MSALAPAAELPRKCATYGGAAYYATPFSF